MSIVEELVANKILQRGEVGLKKYGISMVDESLPLIQWLRHLQDELCDGAVYAEKMILELEMQQNQANIDQNDELVNDYERV